MIENESHVPGFIKDKIDQQCGNNTSGSKRRLLREYKRLAIQAQEEGADMLVFYQALATQEETLTNRHNKRLLEAEFSEDVVVE